MSANEEDETQKLVQEYAEAPEKGGGNATWEEPVKESGLSAELKDKIIELYRLKSEGDELWKKKDYDNAINSYTKAVVSFKKMRNDDSLGTEHIEQLEKEIWISSNLNMSMIDIKRKDWANTIRHCNKVLYVDKGNVKARYRRCTAYVHTGKFEKADEDLIELEDIIGGSKELEELETLFEENKRKSSGNEGEFLKKMGKKMAGKPATHEVNKGKLKKNVNSKEKELKKWFEKFAGWTGEDLGGDDEENQPGFIRRSISCICGFFGQLCQRKQYKYE